ncbi:M56 family metallopeptidase [Mumia sp. DW29H23]|uniref:M56 family metallopeptidase n=1 Tax=Mumia sp. DW29H23 TaxID=3421241 RepID=UPI003D699F7A
MIAVLGLLAFALLLNTIGTRWVVGAAWARRCPAAALTVWHGLAVGTAVSAAAALLLLAHDISEHALIWALAADEAAFHSLYAYDLALPLWWNVAAVPVAAALVWAAAVLMRHLLEIRRTRMSHDRLLQMGQARNLAPDVQVLSHSTPAIYCLARSRSGPVVVTSAALDALSPASLNAAISHERAHLALRHHRSVGLSKVVGSTLGPIGLLRDYPPQVRLLCELAADAAASREVGPRVVAAAILDIATARFDQTALPAATLSADGSDVEVRVRELLHASQGRAGARSRWLARVAATVAIGFPLVAAVGPALTLAGTAG